MLVFDARGGCLQKVKVNLRVCARARGQSQNVLWKKNKNLSLLLLRTECSEFEPPVLYPKQVALYYAFSHRLITQCVVFSTRCSLPPLSSFLFFFSMRVCYQTFVSWINVSTNSTVRALKCVCFCPLISSETDLLMTIVVCIEQSGSLLLLCRPHPSQSGAHTPLARRPRLPDTPSPQSLPTVFFKTPRSFDSSPLSIVTALSLRSYLTSTPF